MENNQQLRPENISDKVRNHLSVFLTFEELILEDFNNKKFIMSIYNAMDESCKELKILLKEKSSTVNLNKFSVTVLLLENYFNGYKTAKEVLQTRNSLGIEKTVSEILSDL